MLGSFSTRFEGIRSVVVLQRMDMTTRTLMRTALILILTADMATATMPRPLAVKHSKANIGPRKMTWTNCAAR